MFFVVNHRNVVEVGIRVLGNRTDDEGRRKPNADGSIEERSKRGKVKHEASPTVGRDVSELSCR